MLALSLTAMAATFGLWTLGAHVTLSPRLSALLLGGGGMAGLVTLAASRRPTIDRRVLLPARLGGLAALGACLAFPPVLYVSTPRDVETWAGREAPSATTPPRRLRLLQLNVLHDYPRFLHADRRMGGLERALETLDPDLVVLQEVWSAAGRENLARRLGRSRGLHVAYARANGSRRLLGFEEGVAVLSRYPLSRPVIWDLAPRKHLFDRRIALAVEVEVEAARPVRVVAAHLTNEAPEVTEAQALDLLRRLEGDSASERALLVAADLNAPRESETLGHFRDAGWLGVRQGERDHLLIRGDSPGWRHLWSEWTLRPEDPATWLGAAGPLSDHPAILAELEPAGAPRVSRWRGAWSDPERRERQRIDLEAIEQAVAEIGEIEGIESVLVVHDGALVAEDYFRGAGRERLQNMKSASKGVISALVGIAISQGHLELDHEISRFLPEARDLDDPRKETITVRDLLSMKSGLESTSFRAYGSWVSSHNWVRDALERPLRAEPGTRFSYSTGNTHLLSAVLTAVTGQSTLEYARENLFGPLGIERVVWERDRQGIYIGGNNLAMRPRDMARFGLLYLDRGRWGDRQVVPWRWVDASTVTSNPGWSRSWGGSYGLLWWLRGSDERGAYNASGFGGQYIVISRADDLVLVITSSEAPKGRGWRRELFSQIRSGIVDSVRAPRNG